MKGTKIFTAALFYFLSIFSIKAQGEDWAKTLNYAKANAELSVRPKAVLLGDSITEGWFREDPEFFRENNLAGRGISGQTTSQILVRMRDDVVNLHPKYVVILCGFNDIALNPGHAVSVETAVGSIKSMCDIAKANKIKPIVCSQLPSYRIYWRPEIKDSYEKVLEFNELLKAYAKEARIPYVDYFNLLADEKTGRIPEKYAPDTVHPSLEGYKVMEEYLLKFLK